MTENTEKKDNRFEMVDGAEQEMESEDLTIRNDELRQQIAYLHEQRIDLNDQLGTITGQHGALQKGARFHFAGVALAALLAKVPEDYPQKRDWFPCVTEAIEIADTMIFNLSQQVEGDNEEDDEDEALEASES